MVYDSIHNPAAWRCYSGAFSHCCADPNACTCGSAYSRANSDAHTYTTTGVNGYACSYSYSCSNTDTHAGSDADSYACPYSYSCSNSNPDACTHFDTCANTYPSTHSDAFAYTRRTISHYNDYRFG